MKMHGMQKVCCVVCDCVVTEASKISKNSTYASTCASN